MCSCRSINSDIHREANDLMADTKIEPGYARSDDPLRKRIWQRLLPLEQRTLLGTVFFFIVLLTLGWVGLNESNRMSEYDSQYTARAIQRGAGTFDSTCSTCHGDHGQGKPGIAPTLNRPEEFNGDRLKQLGFQGTLKDYFTLTISAGRPAKSDPQYLQPMPTWSQDYGGPLRPDQIDDVVAFVMNWGCAYNPKYDPICMGQDLAYSPAGLPTEGPTPTPAPTAKPVSVADVIAKLPKGNPTRGEGIVRGTVALASGAPNCNACHTLDGSPLVGPSLQGVASRIPPSDYQVPAGTADPKLYYLVDSIYNPNAYKAHGFEAVQMFQNYSTGMSQDEQDLADVTSFLLTLK